MSQAESILEIQMLAQRYADAVMRHDADAWSACWAEDGAWHLPGMEQPVKGRDALVATWKAAMEGYPFAVFLVMPSIVEVSGQTATSRGYVEEILENKEGSAMRIYGVYNDELVTENGKWCYKARHYNILYRGAIELTGDKTGYRG